MTTRQTKKKQAGVRLHVALLALAIAQTMGCATEPMPAEDLGEAGAAGAGPVGLATAPVINPQLCDFIAEQANGPLHDEFLEQLNKSSIVGRRKDVLFRKGKYIEVTGIRSFSMNGCRLKMRMDLKLRRPGIRKDAKGYADVKGDLYAAKQRVIRENGTRFTRKRACLRNMDTDNVTLSNASGIAEAIFERRADKKDEDCFSDSGLWNDVENIVALVNALGGNVPELTYEWLPLQDRRD